MTEVLPPTVQLDRCGPCFVYGENVVFCHIEVLPPTVQLDCCGYINIFMMKRCFLSF